jgi:hypothetical protein
MLNRLPSQFLHFVKPSWLKLIFVVELPIFVLIEYE